MAAGLAATQQVHGVLFIDARGWLMRAHRAPDGNIVRELQSWKADPEIAAAMTAAAARESDEAFWGPPVYSDEAGTILNLRRPVQHGGFLGMVVAGVTIADLSTFIADQESESGQNAFILYDREFVLAHPALINDFEGRGRSGHCPR